MSDVQPPADSRESPVDVWRRPIAKAEAVVNGAFACVLTVAGLALVGPDPADSPFPAPPVTADPVPAGSTISSYRPDCGISPTSLEALVPRPERRTPVGGGTC